MTTYYPLHHSENDRNHATDKTSLKALTPSFQGNERLSSPTHNGFMTRPLSPPLNKMDTYFKVPTTTTSTPLRPNNKTWHSLWTNNSTWQPESTADTEQTSPIDLEFLDSPTMHDAFVVDDYFQAVNQSSLSRRYTSPIPPARETSTSIWSFDWNQHYPREHERRHSIAAFNSTTRPLTPPHQQQQIHDYFTPTSTVMIDVQSLGKGMPLHQLEEIQTIYQVQFKAKYRSDFFYVMHDDTKFKLNDMVVVEADRGYDVGHVVSVLETKEQRKKKKLVSDTVVKRIYRHANASELLTYEMKNQDEQKALVLCQAKIKQKELNMEVVDAEYQWDRRKLTFYFKANERIDFRELVRELFKIYKTRIWMCTSASNEH